MNSQISQTIIALAFIHVVVSFVVLCATPLKIKQIGEYLKISISNKILWTVSFLVVLTIGILAIIEYQSVEEGFPNQVPIQDTSSIEEKEDL